MKLELLKHIQKRITSHMNGEDKDPESGLTHLAHAACCIMFLIEHEVRGLGTDDRHVHPPVRELDEEPKAEAPQQETTVGRYNRILSGRPNTTTLPFEVTQETFNSSLEKSLAKLHPTKESVEKEKRGLGEDDRHRHPEAVEAVPELQLQEGLSYVDLEGGIIEIRRRISEGLYEDSAGQRYNSYGTPQPRFTKQSITELTKEIPATHAPLVRRV